MMTDKKGTSPNRFSFYDMNVITTTGNDSSSDNNKGVEMAPLTTMDDDNNAVTATPPLHKIRIKEDSHLNMIVGNSPAPDCSTLCALLAAYVTYMCHYYPRICCSLATIALFVPSYLLIVGVLANPTEHFGIIEHDFTTVQSQYDFTIKDIHHWCIKGDNDSCECDDPLQPFGRLELPRWNKAHAGNVQQIIDIMDEDLTNPDIAFLGGSVVEKMDGKWLGRNDDIRLGRIAKIFNKHFTNQDDEASEENALTAIALGIAGDTNPTVLWRIINGEMPEDFDPKIWWLELGMSDLGRAQCSEEVVVLGFLRVVEEIMNRKPTAKIVINSLFPMADFRDSWQQDMGLEQSFGNKPIKPNHPRKQQNNNPKGGRDGKDRILNHLPRATDDVTADNRYLKSNDSGVRNGPIVRLDPNKKNQPKFNPVTHKEHKVPLWTAIVAINKELAKFSNKHNNVFYFDATDIFTEYDGNLYTLRRDRISPVGIPTDLGFDAWEAAVAARAKKLLAED